MMMRGSAAGGGFEPTDIANCSLWLDPTDAATLTLSGSNVTQWDDKSANGYDVTAVGTGPESGTRTINSLNALDFTVAGGYLYRNNAPINNASDGAWTAFAVCVADLFPNEAHILSHDSSTTSLRVAQVLRFASDRFITLGFNTSGATTVDNGPGGSSTGTAYLVRSAQSGTSLEAFRSGTSDGGPTSTTSQRYSASTQLAVGNTARSGDKPFDGLLGEIITYSRALDSTDIATVESYLNEKWGT